MQWVWVRSVVVTISDSVFFLSAAAAAVRYDNVVFDAGGPNAKAPEDKAGEKPAASAEAVCAMTERVAYRIADSRC